MRSAPYDDDTPAGRHEWNRTIRGWHVAYVVLALVAAVLLITGDIHEDEYPILAFGVLVLLCVWYAFRGVPTLQDEAGASGPLYVGVALLLTIVLFALSSVGAVMMFILYPHIWALLPKRKAMILTLVSILMTAAIMLYHSQDPYGIAAMVVVGLVVALGLGTWITLIIDQSQKRADLVNQLAAAQHELSEASHQAGISAERERLARDIHDTLTQGFASIALLMEAALTDIGSNDQFAKDRLERAIEIAKENLAEARHMTTQLAPPPPLRETSLPEALSRLVERINNDVDAHCDVSIHGTPRPIDTSKETAVLRIVQEALTNARRHAEAEHIRVRLIYADNALSLRIVDDGRGFTPDDTMCGHGLPSMRERATLAGGTISITTSPGQGVTVGVELVA